jgi:hypothetical protein
MAEDGGGERERRQQNYMEADSCKKTKGCILNSHLSARERERRRVVQMIVGWMRERESAWWNFWIATSTRSHPASPTATPSLACSKKKKKRKKLPLSLCAPPGKII